MSLIMSSVDHRDFDDWMITEGGKRDCKISCDKKETAAPLDEAAVDKHNFREPETSKPTPRLRIKNGHF